MTSIPECFVGIDFHQKFSSVCLMDSNGDVLCEANCESNANYIDKFVRWKLGDKQVRLRGAVEACGGTAKLTEDLRQAGWDIDLAHAATVARLRRCRDKTDKQDAFVLADLTRVDYLPKVYLAPERQRQLRSLVRYRQALVFQRTQAKQRVRGLMRECHLVIRGISAWTRAWVCELRLQIDRLGEERSWICARYLEELDQLKKKIAEAEKRIAVAVEGLPYVDRLLSLPGVGVTTAATLLAEIGDFSRFANGKKLSRYCGVAPVNNSTGGNEKQKGIGKACNGGLRRVIIELSHRLSRYVPRWSRMKADLIKQGKSRSVAAVAVANRWLRRLHYDLTATAA